MQNLLCTFFFITKTRLLCSIFCKLLALRNVKLCLKSDANFQEVQSRNLKSHLKIQILPKRKGRFKNQTLVIQVGEKGLECADILISGTEEIHSMAWLATKYDLNTSAIWLRKWYRTAQPYFQEKTEATSGVRQSALFSIFDLKSYS